MIIELFIDGKQEQREYSETGMFRIGRIKFRAPVELKELFFNASLLDFSVGIKYIHLFFKNDNRKYSVICKKENDIDFTLSIIYEIMGLERVLYV